MVTVAFSFPFLAVNAPSGGRVAVVEGWIDTRYMPQVAQLINSGGYDTVLITGTPRNFSYTLHFGDTIIVDLQRPISGQLVINACGSDHTGFALLSAEGLLYTDSVTGVCHDRTTTLSTPTSRLLFTPTYSGIPDPDWELLFLLYTKVNGINLHALQRSVVIHRANGTIEAGTPSYADIAAEELIRSGIPAERIHRLPTVMLGESRTWANAQRFAQEAKARQIEQADVISFGIHSCRSRVAYRTACGGSVNVGVRCIEDPELQRGLWWRTSLGWMKVIRELAGVPTAYLLEAST